MIGWPTQAPDVAVDPADQPIDVVPQSAVLVDALPRRSGHLDEDCLLGVDRPLGDEFTEGAYPLGHALGVVEPVNPEQQDLRVTEIVPDLLGPGFGLLRHRQLVQLGTVDRDRVRPREDSAAVGRADPVAPGLEVEALPYEADEVLRTTRQLEADQVGPEQAFEDLVPPGELLEQLGRGEGDVQEEADPQIRPQAPQHLRHQLELVVLDPDHAAVLGHGRPPPRRSVG